MKEKTLVSAMTVATSLGAYLYAKETGKDSAPYLMIGGFVGALMGEIIYDKSKKKTNDGKKQ